MASNRIGRINEEIQKELASLIRNLKDPRVQSYYTTPFGGSCYTQNTRYKMLWSLCAQSGYTKNRHIP